MVAPCNRRCRAGLAAIAATVALTGVPVTRGAVATTTTVSRNVVYGKDAGQPLTLDVYGTQMGGLRPVVIAIHGGGWTSGDKRLLAPESRALASLGYVVFNVDYGLATSRLPAYRREVDDLRSALEWVQHNARSYGGDARRVGLLGTSAGGYLAAMLATLANSAASHPVRAVVSLSGPMDIEALVQHVRRSGDPSSCGPTNCRKGSRKLTVLLGCPPLDCSPSRLRAASPIFHVNRYTPPFFLANSTDEIVPASQATAMAAQLRRHAIPAAPRLVAGSAHAIQYVRKVAPQAAAFLHRYLAPRSAPTPIARRVRATAEGGDDRWALLAVPVTALLIGGALVVYLRRRRRSLTHRR